MATRSFEQRAAAEAPPPSSARAKGTPRGGAWPLFPRRAGGCARPPAPEVTARARVRGGAEGSERVGRWAPLKGCRVEKASAA